MPESGGTCLPSENTILQDATTRFVGAADNHALDEAKAFFLGKNGQLQTLLRGLPSLPAKERPAVGKQLNALREKIEQLYQEGRDRLRKEKMQRTLSQKIDVTLPGRQIESGGLHPLSLATERAENIFSSIGFGIADGPEIETDYYNFTALNHPPDHPARSMHDTFYTSDGRLLRTHTSPVQIRHMLSHSAPPIRAIAPGRVYRCDHDATHSPMFHQIEGIWIDDTVTFTGLKGVLGAFFRAFFDDDDIALRFRPSYFPLTMDDMPPIMPPSASPCCSSATSNVSVLQHALVPSSKVNFSSSSAKRTRMLLAILSKSKACNGCPSANIT
jgi:phenylalanyl-tRNA synthetase alpha chain